MNHQEQTQFEEEMVRIAWPHIQALCRRRWCALEPEDRFSEALYFFVCALRSLPIHTGHFFEDYQAGLSLYMSALCKSSERYKSLSLDSAVSRSGRMTTWKPYDYLSSSQVSIEDTVLVRLFTETLPPDEKHLLQDYLFGRYTLRELTGKYACTKRKIQNTLRQISETFFYGV